MLVICQSDGRAEEFTSFDSSHAIFYDWLLLVLLIPDKICHDYTSENISLFHPWEITVVSAEATDCCLLQALWKCAVMRLSTVDR